MRKVLALAAAVCLGVGLDRAWSGAGSTAVAAGGGGGGTPVCATQNGDVNADGKLDLSDAVSILGYLFQGSPTEIVGLCAAQDLEACQAERATSQAALAQCQSDLQTSTASFTAQVMEFQTQLADCRVGNCPGLPATGGTRCYDQSGAEISCDSASCPGQDGLYKEGCPSEGRFVDNGDGTVTDTCTGLMWQKDTADVNGDGQTPDDSGSDALPWCEALAYCESLSFAGHDDWRLPNVRELQSIVDYGRLFPSIDPVFGALSSQYWSSTSRTIYLDRAWLVDFISGFITGGDKVVHYVVRAVRRGP